MTLFVFHFPFYIQSEPQLVAAIIFLPSSFMITICEMTLHFSLISIHSNGSSKAKYIKAASIRMDHTNVKVKVKMVCVKLKPYTSQSHMFNKLTLPTLLFNSPHTIHTNQYLCFSLDSVLNTEVKYNKKRSFLRKNYTVLCNIALWSIIFHTQLNEYAAYKILKFSFQHILTTKLPKKHKATLNYPTWNYYCPYITSWFQTCFSSARLFYHKCSIFLFNYLPSYNAKYLTESCALSIVLINEIILPDWIFCH